MLLFQISCDIMLSCWWICSCCSTIFFCKCLQRLVMESKCSRLFYHPFFSCSMRILEGELVWCANAALSWLDTQPLKLGHDGLPESFVSIYVSLSLMTGDLSHGSLQAGAGTNWEWHVAGKPCECKKKALRWRFHGLKLINMAGHNFSEIMLGLKKGVKSTFLCLTQLKRLDLFHNTCVILIYFVEDDLIKTSICKV